MLTLLNMQNEAASELFSLSNYIITHARLEHQDEWYIHIYLYRVTILLSS